MSDTMTPPPIPRPWHVEIEGQAQGPFTLGDLARMAGEGRLKPQTLVWKEGLGDWKEAQFVGEVAPLMAAARPLPPRSAPPPAKPGMPLFVKLLLFGAVGFVILLVVIFFWTFFFVTGPNFREAQSRSREAQSRSKLARVRGDLRTMTIALETYYLDQNSYPAWSVDRSRKALGEYSQADQPGFTIKRDRNDQLITLTTPVAYITSYFNDPFSPQAGATFSYWSPALAEQGASGKGPQGVGYIIWSPGPDGRYDLNLGNIAAIYDPAHDGPSPALLEKTYDPTNGASSGGDIWRIKQ